ncbi:MAG TPA: cyclic nucleotide-binding domain-containing protein [Micropepsaceae bacterium]|nr:cyclic nucleotide-binding domain-containing protein [Micropepsaceae bacterium]
MSIAEAVRPAVHAFNPAIWPGIAKGPIGRPDEDMKLLQRVGAKLSFGRGETIFNDGDPAEHAYQVVSGVVRLCKHMSDGRRQIAQFMMPGDFFSFLDLAEHTFSAEAVNDVVVFCYPHHQIERLAEERRTMRKSFTAVLTRRVRDIQNHLVTLGRQTAREKVAAFLVFLSDHDAWERDSILNVAMNRQDIADYLGLTIETVCRVLSAMKREGLIGILNLHQFVVKDIETLRAIADGDD